MAERLIERIAISAKGPGKLPVILKSEILHDTSMCLDDDSVETYQSRSLEKRSERYRDLILRKTVSFDGYKAVFAACRKNGIAVCMSVYDVAGADFVVQEGVSAIKIASSNVTHLPLIRYVAGLNVPILIDTGRSTLAEVDRAFRTARDAGARDILIEHSPDGHPAPAVNHNLRSLKTLHRCFEVPVGLSDHAMSTNMMHVSIGLGVNLIERNITEDPDRFDQDYAFSTGVAELEGLLRDLHDSWAALGRSFRDINNRSGLVSTSARMGLITRRAVKSGETISDDTIRYGFPNRGIGVERIDEVTGWIFKNDMPADKPINWPMSLPIDLPGPPTFTGAVERIPLLAEPSHTAVSALRSAIPLADRINVLPAMTCRRLLAAIVCP